MVKSGQLQPKQLTAALVSLRALQLDWKTHIIRILAVKRDGENAYCRCHISSKPQLTGASRATQEKQYQCPSLKSFMKNGTFFCYCNATTGKDGKKYHPQAFTWKFWPKRPPLNSRRWCRSAEVALNPKAGAHLLGKSSKIGTLPCCDMPATMEMQSEIIS